MWEVIATSHSLMFISLRIDYRRLMETFFNVHLFMDWLPKVNGDLLSLFLPTKLQKYLYLHLFYKCRYAVPAE